MVFRGTLANGTATCGDAFQDALVLRRGTMTMPGLVIFEAVRDDPIGSM
jgi:hypothetical protein